MMNLLKRLRKNDEGATAVEFAFIVPIVFLFMFGFFEFCLVLFTQGVLHFSAEEATRYAMVNFEQDNVAEEYIASIRDDIEAVARSKFVMISDEKISNFDVSVITNPSDMTKTVDITIDYSYTMSMPFIEHTTFTLRGESKSFLVQ